MRAAAWLLALALFLPAARASNYYLDQIAAVASRPEIRSLQRIGIRTTDQLIWYGATPAQRAQLSQVTGITAERLAVLAALADLMRLRGIGPDAARLLHAAGCHSIGELQQADAQALAAAVKRTNDRAHLSTNPPRADNLRVWISSARRLQPLYQPETRS